MCFYQCSKAEPSGTAREFQNPELDLTSAILQYCRLQYINKTKECVMHYQLSSLLDLTLFSNVYFL